MIITATPEPNEGMRNLQKTEWNIDETIMQIKETAEHFLHDYKRCDDKDGCMFCHHDCKDEHKKHKQIAEWLEELKYFKDNQEKKTLIILPCSIGADVYKIPSETNYRLNILNGHAEWNKVYHQKVHQVDVNEHGWCLVGDKDAEYGTGRLFLEQFFGETWFLSEEEAEQALQRYGKSAPRAIYEGYNSHDCEAWYSCPICNEKFGSWSVKKNDNGRKCCPSCKTELDGLD